MGTRGKVEKGVLGTCVVIGYAFASTRHLQREAGQVLAQVKPIVGRYPGHGMEGQSQEPSPGLRATDSSHLGVSNLSTRKGPWL